MPFTVRTDVRAAVTIGATVIAPLHQLRHQPIWSEPDPVPELANAAVASSVAVAPDMGLGAFACSMPMQPRNICR
jgi:hypothetical protein